MIAKYDVSPIVMEDTSTHKDGNHLDQIFTNLEHKSYQCDEWKDVTDHKSIFAEVMLNTKRKQALRTHTDFYSQKVLRGACLK
jgi:hypothetical protein